MKIFVTGATGMLGAELTRTLCEQGHEVHTYTRSEVNHPYLNDASFTAHRGELSDRSALEAAMAGCQQVYHVAGMISYRNRDLPKLQAANVEGTRTLMDAAQKVGVERVVVTSSTAAIGTGMIGDPPLTETSPFPAANEKVPYMTTKRDAEQLALSFTAPEVVSANPTTIYGAGDVKLNTGVVFQKIKAGKLNSCPPGSTSIVSVKDCVAGHLSAMEKGQPGERYILATSDHTFRELFTLIAEAVDAPPPQKTLPKWIGPLAYAGTALSELFGGKVSRHVITIGFRNRCFDATKAKTELGWKPAQDAKAMLNEAAEFYREQGAL